MQKIASQPPSVNIATLAFSAIYRCCLVTIDRAAHRPPNSPFSARLLAATITYLTVLASVNAPLWGIYTRLFCYPQQQSCLQRRLYRDFDGIVRHTKQLKNLTRPTHFPSPQQTNVNNEAANLLRSTAQLLTVH